MPSSNFILSLIDFFKILDWLKFVLSEYLLLLLCLVIVVKIIILFVFVSLLLIHCNCFSFPLLVAGFFEVAFCGAPAIQMKRLHVASPPPQFKCCLRSLLQRGRTRFNFKFPTHRRRRLLNEATVSTC